MLKESFYVKRIGSSFEIMAVGYPTFERALQAGIAGASDAIETHVYDCSKGPCGVLVARIGRNGQQLPC